MRAVSQTDCRLRPRVWTYEFQDEDTLRQKLLYAIESGAGFELSWPLPAGTLLHIDSRVNLAADYVISAGSLPHGDCCYW